MGAKVYNELPLEIRKTVDYKEFVKKLSSQYFSTRTGFYGFGHIL